MNLNAEYKSKVCAESYLGTKGYTIPKSALTAKDIEFLKKDLFLKPQTSGPSFGPALDDAFPVYRENEKKMYIPRFYGIERYGQPARNEIAPGMDIDVAFTKELRDYQNNIVDIYIQGTYGSLVRTLPSNGTCVENPRGEAPANGGRAGGSPAFGGILEIYCGAGKCLGINTPILMYDGSIKLVQDVIEGDVLMGDDSTPRNVLTLARGREMMYRVRGDDASYVVNRSHILSLKHGKTDKIHDISVKDYLNLPKAMSDMLRGYRVAVDYKKKDVLVDPYVAGFCIGDDRILSERSKYALENAMRFLKHIPDIYKYNDRSTRMELLAGILDYNGSCHSDKWFVVEQKIETLCDDIIQIARSLGYDTVKSVRDALYRVSICGKGLEEIPTRRPGNRKLVRLNERPRDLLKYKFTLEELEIDDYYGFEIDGNRRFVLGDFTVTHNTVMALKIVSLLKKKTLILVHKEFLMNQWIERIEEFLPGARVGKIQANVCDCENKDIVIGMIQTMYNKVFSQEVYSQFGLTIVDEVHRIGSEEFSKTLLKTITPYMLGISATVERKDKLTKLLYMFIGPKIHSMLRKQDDIVNVRGIEYTTNDPGFNEVERDWKGQPKYSTMISKICEFGPRRDFIVKVVRDLVEESPDSQIMVLAHNRSLLTYLHEVLAGASVGTEATATGGRAGGYAPATVGFYVGGMKQKDLQATESKQVVLATYAMAAEALDIKTLSTLVMATPKTDITQSVGRILRMKHANPIIVDIIDPHDTFQNQWKVRKRYYKKCNYKIQTIVNTKYKDMTEMDSDDWFTVFDPTATKSKKTKAEKEKDDSDDEDKHTTEFKGKCSIDISGLDFD